MAERTRELISSAERKLRERGISSSRLDAELLLAFTCGCEREMILTHLDREIPDRDALRFHEMIERRALRYPLQYLLHRQEFYSLEFYVDERVLIPRPESELIVDELLKLNDKESPLIADIGTGSGNLAVTIAVQLPGARIYATDISAQALEVAAMNAARHIGAERITFLTGNYTEPLARLPGLPLFDFIISNPPYVAASEIGSLQDEVRLYEPVNALLSGEDGLESYRKIVNASYQLLAEGGSLILEVASERAENVQEILSIAPFNRTYVVRDMQRIDRITVGTK